jgi:site-specific recombinase XerD
VTAYCQSLADRGLKHETYRRVEDHLKKLLQLEPNGARRVSWLAGRGQELYDESRADLAVDTHRSGLTVCKGFGEYAITKGWIKQNPFQGVEGVGRRKRGRPQLRVDEARKLTDHCLALCADGAKSEPVAVLTALVLGSRATEVVMRDVRDLAVEIPP